MAILTSLGYLCDEADDPYVAMAQLFRKPGTYVAVILNLTAVYKEELQIIQTIKARMPQLDVWLAQTDGRHGAMSQAIGLGADGLLADDGLHRIGIPAAAQSPDRSLGALVPIRQNGSANGYKDPPAAPEPVLSPEELRALLQEQPFLAENED